MSQKQNFLATNCKYYPNLLLLKEKRHTNEMLDDPCVLVRYTGMMVKLITLHRLYHTPKAPLQSQTSILVTVLLMVISIAYIGKN